MFCGQKSPFLNSLPMLPPSVYGCCHSTVLSWHVVFILPCYQARQISEIMFPLRTAELAGVTRLASRAWRDARCRSSYRTSRWILIKPLCIAHNTHKYCIPCIKQVNDITDRTGTSSFDSAGSAFLRAMSGADQGALPPNFHKFSY